MDEVQTALVENLMSQARLARNHAYAPYSHYMVGAAFISESGHVYKGCNVENISYGLTCCAERNAIAQGVVSEGPGLRIQTLLVLNREEDDCSPCGACRQVIKEFSNSQSRILFHSGGALQNIDVAALLPFSFSFAPEIAHKDSLNG